MKSILNIFCVLHKRCKLNIIPACTHVHKRLRIGFASLEKQEFYEEVEQAARIAGDKLCIEVICKSPVRYNVAEQAAIFEEFVARGTDGIIVVPSDAQRFKQLINRAVSKDIKVACVDSDVPESKRNLYITSDSYQGGRLAGEAANRHLKGRGKILALLCAAGVPTVQQRFQGFADIVAGCPGLHIIRKCEQADTDLFKTRTIIERMIKETPDFDLLYLVNGDAGEIAADIWKSQRLDKKLIVLSKSTKITRAIREGIVSSQIVQRNALWGEMAVLYLSRMLKHEQVLSYENTGMYEINQMNLPVFEKYK